MINLSLTYRYPVQCKHLAETQGDLVFDFKTEARLIGIVGPSGSGKTSLLRMIAGLIPAKGSLEVDGVVWQNDQINLTTAQRQLSLIQQESGLFPHLSVAKNIFFGIEKSEHELIDLLELSALMDRPIQSLSHGQSKRVELVRAILREPLILLLDEFFYGLERRLREVLYQYLLEWSNHTNTNILFSTHQNEVLHALANEVVQINRDSTNSLVELDKALML